MQKHARDDNIITKTMCLSGEIVKKYINGFKNAVHLPLIHR